MTSSQIKVASLLLKEHFGDIVQKVGEYLMKSGPSSLAMVIRDIKEKPSKVKLAIAVLILHNMAIFEKNSQNNVMYKMIIDNVLLILRYPRYIFCCKTLFGEMAELMIEELLKNGQMAMSSVIQNVLERLKESGVDDEINTIETLKTKFTTLVQIQFIQRCPAVKETDNSDPIPSFSLSEKEIFSVPEVGVEYLTHKRKRSTEPNTSSPPVKRAKYDNDNVPDHSIYWKVNFDRLHQFFRDQAIISAVANRIDPQAGEIIQTLLRLMEVRNDPWTPVTNPVSKYDLAQAMSKDLGIKPLELDQYLSVFVDDSTGFVHKQGDSQGGLYAINMKKAVISLTWATVETVVAERFGPKCFRIFRLLRMKKYLEQKQIEDMAMIPPKDAKEMTYKLFQENFIQFQEIPKTPDYAPSRTFFLFHIDLTKLVRMLLEFTYKALFNAKSRESYELRENKRALEKKQKVDAILASLQAQGADPAQLQEIKELISPPEKAQLDRVKHICNKLQQSEIQLEETLFILETYLRYIKE